MAGALPMQETAEPPDPAAPEALPYVSAQAARLFVSPFPILRERGTAGVDRGSSTTPPTDPAGVAAQRAAHHGEIARVASDVLPLIGERGRWLARLNPAWRPCVHRPRTPPVATPGKPGIARSEWRRWSSCARSTRAGARVLLEEVRASEPLETLAALIPALGVSLSAEDEPLPESLLDDKRKTIRRPAANLLLRLPATGYQQRMTARAAACVAVTPARAGSLFPPRLKQEVKLEVTLPDKFAADWTRDALEETPPRASELKAGGCSRCVSRAAAPLGNRRPVQRGGTRGRGTFVRTPRPAAARMAARGTVSAQCTLDDCNGAFEQCRRVLLRPDRGLRGVVPVQREQVLLALLLGETPPAQGIIFDLLCVITSRGARNSPGECSLISSTPDSAIASSRWHIISTRITCRRAGQSFSRRRASPRGHSRRVCSPSCNFVKSCIKLSRRAYEWNSPRAIRAAICRGIAGIGHTGHPATAAELATLPLGGHALPAGGQAGERLCRHAEIYRQSPADGNRRGHAGHRPRFVAARSARHRQNLGVRASGGGHLR